MAPRTCGVLNERGGDDHGGISLEGSATESRSFNQAHRLRRTTRHGPKDGIIFASFSHGLLSYGKCIRIEI